MSDLKPFWRRERSQKIWCVTIKILFKINNSSIRLVCVYKIKSKEVRLRNNLSYYLVGLYCIHCGILLHERSSLRDYCLRTTTTSLLYPKKSQLTWLILFLFSYLGTTHFGVVFLEIEFRERKKSLVVVFWNLCECSLHQSSTTLKLCSHLIKHWFINVQ